MLILKFVIVSFLQKLEHYLVMFQFFIIFAGSKMIDTDENSRAYIIIFIDYGDVTDGLQ